MTKSVLRFGMRVAVLALVLFAVAGCEFLEQFFGHSGPPDYSWEKTRQQAPPH